MLQFIQLDWIGHTSVPTPPYLSFYQHKNWKILEINQGNKLKIGVFTPAGMLAEFPAMITPKDNNSIVSELEPVKLIEQTTNHRIDVGNASVITMNQSAR